MEKVVGIVITATIFVVCFAVIGRMGSSRFRADGLLGPTCSDFRIHSL